MEVSFEGCFHSGEQDKVHQNQIETVGRLGKHCDAVLGQEVIDYLAKGVAWCIVTMTLPTGGNVRPHTIDPSLKPFQQNLMAQCYLTKHCIFKLKPRLETEVH